MLVKAYGISKCYDKKLRNNNPISSAIDMTYLNIFDMTVIYLYIPNLSFTLQLKYKVDSEELVIKIN